MPRTLNRKIYFYSKFFICHCLLIGASTSLCVDLDPIHTTRLLDVWNDAEVIYTQELGHEKLSQALKADSKVIDNIEIHPEDSSDIKVKKINLLLIGGFVSYRHQKTRQAARWIEKVVEHLDYDKLHAIIDAEHILPISQAIDEVGRYFENKNQLNKAMHCHLTAALLRGNAFADYYIALVLSKDKEFKSASTWYEIAYKRLKDARLRNIFSNRNTHLHIAVLLGGYATNIQSFAFTFESQSKQEEILSESAKLFEDGYLQVQGYFSEIDQKRYLEGQVDSGIFRFLLRYQEFLNHQKDYNKINELNEFIVNLEQKYGGVKSRIKQMRWKLKLKALQSWFNWLIYPYNSIDQKNRLHLQGLVKNFESGHAFTSDGLYTIIDQ